VTPARLSFVSEDLLSKYEEMGIPISAELKRKVRIFLEFSENVEIGYCLCGY
jgi:hypothetical protein